MELHAGTVMAGMQLSSFPQTPWSMTRLKFGSSSRHCSKTSSGGAQSSPITSTFFRRFMNICLSRYIFAGSYLSSSIFHRANQPLFYFPIAIAHFFVIGRDKSGPYIQRLRCIVHSDSQHIIFDGRNTLSRSEDAVINLHALLCLLNRLASYGWVHISHAREDETNRAQHIFTSLPIVTDVAFFCIITSKNGLWYRK